MDAPEMHIMFRQYAQQMGMQNVRAILPEQIDLLINTSITDTINQLIKENIGITNDRVITDTSKVGQINALRSLYKVNEVTATPSDAPTSDKPFTSGAETYIKRITAPLNLLSANGRSEFNYLFLVDLSINYTGNNDVRTNYFPIRLIDDIYLADTLNDFVLAPRVRTPIAVIYNNKLDIYIDTLKEGELPQGLEPYKLRVSYIAKPAKVAFLQDVGGTNVDCDLPEYMHVDIVKHAVDLYHIAISGSMMAAQAQEQNARQENVRNNYRNEGNAQQQ